MDARTQNTTNPETFNLSESKEWDDSEHESKTSTPQTQQLTLCQHTRNGMAVRINARAPTP